MRSPDGEGWTQDFQSWSRVRGHRWVFHPKVIEGRSPGLRFLYTVDFSPGSDRRRDNGEHVPRECEAVEEEHQCS